MRVTNAREFIEDAASENGSKTFLMFGNERVSYSQFNEAINRYANALLEGGVGKGDHIAIKLRNRPEFLYCWLGLAKIGAVSVPINTSLKSNETADILEHSRSRVLISSTDFSEDVRRVMESHPLPLRTVLVDSPGESLNERAGHSSKDSPETAISPEDPMTIIYTSGTTGKPKGVVQAHRTYVHTGQSFPYWLGLESADVLFTCLPLFHINAQAYSTFGSMGAGASLALAGKFSASGFWQQAKELKATQFNSVGSMLMMLLKQPTGEAEHDHRVRLVYCALSLPEKHVTEFEERFGVRVVSGYGMSECTFGTIEPLSLPRRVGTIGLPRQHPLAQDFNQVKIVNERGDEVGRGELGEIVLKNPAIMKEYYRDPESTSNTLKEGWLYTGDIGYRDGDGFFYFFGRKKDIIRRRGENVSPAEIESVVAQHPSVLECAVIGVPSELSEEEIKLYAVPRQGAPLTPFELVQWCSDRLASFKVPRFIELRSDLPKTETQRVAKHVLKKEKPDLRSGSYDAELGKAV